MSYERIDPIRDFLEQHASYYRLGVGTVARVTPPLPRQQVVQSPPVAPRQPSTFGDVLVGLAKIAAVGAVAYVGYKAIDELTMPKRRRHDREVSRAANDEVKQGRFVAADIRGWAKPDVIDGHRPDVYSFDPHDGTERVIEVEHPSTVFEAHSISQVTTFDRWATRSKKRESILRLTSRG